MSTTPLYTCPRCLTPGVAFAESVNPMDGERYWKCPVPDCGKDNIPFRYTAAYERHRLVPFSILGGTGHGKTMFLVALFQQLRAVGNRWPGFYADPLDEYQAGKLEEKLLRYQSGEVEDATYTDDLPEPMVVRYTRIPRVGDVQMSFFDTGGEAFENSARLRKAGRYVRNSPAVVWLASLQEPPAVGSPAEPVRPWDLDRIATAYLQAMANMGGDPKKQTLVLTLTKGERLVNLPGFPASAADVLQSDLVDPGVDWWGQLEAASDELLAWLAVTQYAELLNKLIASFKAVRVCAVSAQGRELTAGEPTAFDPKAVLAPLYWLWRADRPGVWVEAGPRRTYHLSVEEAVKAAPANAVVRLEAGVHSLTAPLEILKPIALVGEGKDRTTLLGATGKFSVGFAPNGSARLADLTVERPPGGGPGDLVWALRGTLAVSDARFRKAASAPLPQPAPGENPDAEPKAVDGNGLVFGRDAGGSVERCEFAENARAGLWVFARQRVTATDCTARGNRYGVLLSGPADVAIAGGTWERNRRLGVWVADQAQLTMTGGKAVANERDGVRVTEDGRVRLTDVEAVGNGGSGVAFRKRGGGTVDGGTFDRNEAGVTAAGEANVEVLRATATGNRSDGVRFGEQTQGLVERCTLRGNGGYGLRLDGTTRADARDTATDGNHTAVTRPSVRPAAGVLVAATVPKQVRVADCGGVADDRKKGLFG